MAKVVLGLSGGVDSAVAAALLKQQGHSVTGVFLDIGMVSSKDAEKNAALLGIDFRICNIKEQLDKNVCTPFIETYLKGKTPSPCILCNPLVKFPTLIAEADKIGAEYVATGHYARIEYRENLNRFALKRAASENDQSYMLSRLTQGILSRLIFPLGETPKSSVRKKAVELCLPVAEKPDSMEICFIPDGDYASFIERRGFVPAPGDFVDETGNVLGLHKGIHHYTVGQRRGLGISSGERLFVSEIRPETNQVVLSPGDEMTVSSIDANKVGWVSVPAIETPFHATVKVRHSKAEYPAFFFPNGDRINIEFESPIRRPAAGQTAVFYDSDYVLGGADIL